MPPKKRPAAGPLKEPSPKVAKEESPWEKQLRLAIDRLEIAQGDLKTAKASKNAKKVEAAKKEVEAAKKEVEAAKKEVVAGPAQELPRPTLEMDVKLSELKDKEFTANTLLNVEAFKDFVAPNTTADRPLFLRKHLLNVHNKAVEALQAEKIRLVSLVGCPGTGKTWCGWLVAYTLQKARKKTTLHLTIRNYDVTAIANFKEKKQYEDVHWNGRMLKQVLRESQCQVCIVDVSMNKPDAAADIFTGIQQLIERNEKEFAHVKFMGLMSGHGETKIVGKPSLHLSPCKLVLWSWTKDEVEELREKLGDAGAPPAHAYAVCGGSVRFLFKTDDVRLEEEVIRAAVRGLEQADMARLLALDLGLDDVDKKHRTGLLSFFPRQGSNANDESFAQGVSAAQPMPRSDFVIKCIKQNKYAKFEEVLNMYRVLSEMNPGAAGSAFELLVHLFWREAATNKQKVELSLKGAKVEVDCAEFQQWPESIEEYDEEAVAVHNNLVGYFTPDSPRYPVLDSIVRFKLADKTEVLAIQISIAKEHGHGLLEPLPKLLQGANRLAFWDFRKGEKPCEWKPKESHDWELLHVSCQDFDKRMGCS